MTTIFGNTLQDLQNNLNLLKDYCNKWGLAVNTNKTKVVVFRKRGNTRQNETWKYNGYSLEVVDNFNYLGTIFNYTGNFSLNQEYLAGKGLKALNVLMNNLKHYNLEPKTKCQLFDAFVGATLNYACEVCGNTKSKEIERVHLKFCKQLLRVKSSTSNMSVYGELGRYPLFINRYTRMIKYWCKIIRTGNTLVNTLYRALVSMTSNGASNIWVCSIKSLLENYWFSYVWINEDNIDLHKFPILFKQRVYETFAQTWFNNVNNSSVLYS